MNVIETSDLGKRYGKSWALRDCTLTVPAGHLAALVGPNGAGKSTLMNMTAGLTVPTSGTATVLDGHPAGSPAALNGVAFVAQDAPVYKNLSAGDMLHLTRNLNQHFDTAVRAGAPGRPRHPAEQEGGQALRRSAVTARAHAGAGPTAAAAHPG